MKPDVVKLFADAPFQPGKLHISFRSIEIGTRHRYVGPNPDKQVLAAAFASRQHNIWFQLCPYQCSTSYIGLSC